MKCWGYNGDGRLGYGNTNPIGATQPPSSVGPISVTTTPGLTVKALAGGPFHSCALLSDGSVTCWGNNNDGDLGYGNTASIGDDELPSSVGPIKLF